MNKVLALLLLIALGGMTACNTMDGAGKDIQRGGSAVSHAANKVQSKL